jgi:predicted nuclease of predicted toxin-antitoxin system
MRWLLDENLPHGLRDDLAEAGDVATAQEMGWAGFNDHRLLTAASEKGFDYLLTIDKNLRYQQNLSRFSIRVVVLMAVNNRRETLRQLAVKAVSEVRQGFEGRVIEIR